MYSPWMSRLLLYFDLWGFSTRFNKLTKQLKFSLFFFVLHIILASISSYLIFKYLLRPNDDTLGTLNDLIKFVVMITSYWLSIVELFFKRKTQDRIWRQVEYIDQHFCCHRQFSRASYMFKLKMYFGLAGVGYFVFMYSLCLKTGTKYLYFWFPYIFVMVSFQNRSFYYIFYLEFVAYELQMVCREVNEMMKALARNHLGLRNVFAEKFQRKRFRWMRGYFESIHNLCQTLNVLFGFSNVASILLAFFIVIADMNWLHWKILNEYEPNILGK